MNEHNRQYVEMMEALFAMPGWALLQDDIAGYRSAIAAGWRSVSSEKQLFFEQGRDSGLEQIQNYEALIANVKTALENNDE